MGQKVSPIGMRVGVIRDWESRWYADKANFGDLLNEDVKIRKFLDTELKDAYVSRIEIERVSKQDCKIIVRCARPGAMVGKSEDGKDKLDALRAKLGKLTNGKNIKIEVIQVANPDLDATLVARKICEQLEARQSFRIAQKKAIQQTMRSGAKGIKTLASGRLGGAEIARSEGYSQGVVPLHTLRSDIDYAWAEAHTTYGKLGVKVWICRGEVLPGQMVTEPEAPARTGRDNRRNGRGRNDRRNSRPARQAENNDAAEATQENARNESQGGNE
ncbi:MAG: 30S ribosomal protein S3 [Solobacterium sp.]|nr:30S ribosomal protein S3 [Solobacterium sp.]MBQ6221726.1 30S ribosomal protein S3 [Solobacterium sp.]MBR2668697.1 30S ribosomal protein S3 [Solobacterium sp.]